MSPNLTRLLNGGFDARMRAWRRHLHQHPETAFAEHATAGYVADVLEQLGYVVARGVGGTGVVGALTRGTSTRAVGLRADMDALPIEEVGGREYGSRNPGAMHACGHDGHMSMVLGAAAVLAADGGSAPSPTPTSSPQPSTMPRAPAPPRTRPSRP